MSPEITFSARSLYHGWLPRYPEVHRAFLDKHVAGTICGPTVCGNISVTNFIDVIRNSPVMKPLSDAMFNQVNKDTKWESSDERFRVRDLEHLKNALNSALQGPPEVLVVENDAGEKIGEPIGCPIYLIFDLLVNTSAGYDLFRLEEFNQAMKTLLDNWGRYLAEPGSNATLTEEENGWFSAYSLSVLEHGLNGQSFEATYGAEPAKARQTYQSWDAFFTRPFADMDKLRPVETFYNKLTLIHNACESTSLRIAHNVRLNDTFWLKGQNYSLYDMLGGDPQINPQSLSKYAPQFVGATVYQAFLSPQDYHRWHCPVKGIILEANKLPGTYYAALPDEGAPTGDLDMQPGDPHGALIRSQPWLTVTAARGILIIRPDEPSDLELVAFIGIGMAEVSTIDITVSKHVHVEAGDELGMFHFGGSSHALILKTKKNKKIVFKDISDVHITPGQHRLIRSIIGHVVDDIQV